MGHFRSNVYEQRCELMAETLLFEANRQGAKAERDVCAVTVGLGLGVWAGDLKNLPARPGSRMADGRFLKEIYTRAFLKCIAIHSKTLQHIKVFEFNYAFDGLFWKQQEDLVQLLKECGAEVSEPREEEFEYYVIVNGIKVTFTRNAGCRNGNPFAEAPQYHDPDQPQAGPGPLIVTNYAWDSNSYPGNEIYWRMLQGSGDPAAWCCSTVGRAGNPEINTEYLSGYNAVVNGPEGSVPLKPAYQFGAEQQPAQVKMIPCLKRRSIPCLKSRIPCLKRSRYRILMIAPRMRNYGHV